jgi:hypothetical protein
MKESSAETPGSSLWPMTDWSGVGHAATAVGKDPARLNHLILTYRVPLKVYLLSTFPALTNQADEFLQDFAQDKILREGWLGHANRTRGRFRNFLKTSLRNFVMDRLRRGANPPVSLDELDFEPPAKAPSDDLFDLNWVRAIVSETLVRMEKDCRTAGKDQPGRAQIWELFQLRVVQPEIEGAEPVGYEDLVSRFGLVSPFEAHNMLATAKRIFTRHLNGVIAEYEGGGQAARFELDEIKRSLSCLSRKRKR